MPTVEDRRRATLAVADSSTSAHECKLLLDMLGLDPHEGLGGAA